MKEGLDWCYSFPFFQPCWFSWSTSHSKSAIQALAWLKKA